MCFFKRTEYKLQLTGFPVDSNFLKIPKHMDFDKYCDFYYILICFYFIFLSL